MKVSIAHAVLTAFIIAASVSAEEPQVLPREQEVLHDTLARESWFIAKIGELSPSEREALASQARESLNGWRARIQPSMSGPCIRRELAQLVQAISPPAWAKFMAEEQRLRVRHRHAAVLVQVAEFDEAMSLSAEQRDELNELFATGGDGVGWCPDAQTTSVIPFLWPRKNIIAAGELGSFFISDARLKTILQSWQFRRYRAFMSGLPESKQTLEIVWPRQPAMLVDESDGPQGREAKQPAPATLTKNQEQWLYEYLERLVENIAEGARLSEEQRAGLSAAGRLDIQRWRDAGSLGFNDFPVSPIFANITKVVGGISTVRAEIFDVAESAFQKFTHGRLADDQKRLLAAAEAERYQFRRQALVEAVVVGLERSAALTARECTALEERLNQTLAGCPSTLHWRSEWLKTIAELPEEEIRPGFTHEQWPAVVRQLTRLGGIGQ